MRSNPPYVGEDPNSFSVTDSHDEGSLDPYDPCILRSLLMLMMKILLIGFL